ncbi:hypothetical protein P43SY_011331 [Pythium insidiosum]|uniref:Transmembrane protein n=1 Tax=Pythium insidiosum TaxID=114742 RepID=A0AAD5Q5V4_PYTIN|nr:hypothetical protein P43SY_011331 [Pythium insidiosum]
MVARTSSECLEMIGSCTALTVAAPSLRRRQERIRNVIQSQTPSLIRIGFALLSFSLLLSDTLRTGLAVRSLAPFTPFDADAVTMFGPFAFPLPRMPITNTSTLEPQLFWPYKTTCKLLVLVPNQAVVYGSLFPVACYTSAYVMDATMMQQFMDGHFSSLLGVYELKVTQVLTLGAVALRSGWLVALVGHVVVGVWSRRSWSPPVGALGMPELAMTAMICGTVIAQMRVGSWRDSRVVEVHEASPSAIQPLVRAGRSTRGHTTIDHLLTGTAIDVQFITLALLLCAALTALIRLLRQALPRAVRYQINMLIRLNVAYSTGTLWGVNMFVVSWFGSIMSRSKLPLRATSVRRLIWGNRRVLLAARTRADQVSETAAPILDLHGRSQDDDAYVLLMNLTMLTDPLVFLRLRLGDGVSLVLVHSKQNDCYYLLPSELFTTATMDVPIEWDAFQIVSEVRSSHIAWWQLLQCG